jgi:hypothetical protein
MANVQISKIQIIADRPFGGFPDFNVGDVLDIYIDTALAVAPVSPWAASSTGITVNKNGVSYPSTGSDDLILATRNVHYVVQEFNPQICVGTSLLDFGNYPFFPYATYYTLENHNACTVNPETCDLMVVGAPSVVSTGSGVPDGSITVTATSTNAIQYKLGSDFVYGDGSAQATGVFTGLLPGTYRIYIRDSVNCGVNILIIVPINNQFGTKFRLEYDDAEGVRTRLDITKRGYSGSITEVTAGNKPFEASLRGEASEDKFEPLMAISCVLNLVSLTDQQFLEIYTNDPNLYRIHYSKGAAPDLKGVYKILPQQYHEEFKAQPYFVSVTATDGLPELRNFHLIHDDGQKFFGTEKLIKIIAHCLSFNKLELPIRVACNMYAVGMNQAATDDPLDQAYADYERFYLTENQPTIEFVLRSILETFNARITQWEGRWNIVRVEEMTAAYDYRDFDKDGLYVSNGTFQPTIDIGFPIQEPGLLLANGNHNLEIKPGYGKIIVNYNLGLKPNILKNGDFRLTQKLHPISQFYYSEIDKQGFQLVNAGYNIFETHEFIGNTGNVAYKITGGTDTTGEAYVQSEKVNIKMAINDSLKITIRYKIPAPVGVTTRTPIVGDPELIPIEIPIEYQKVRIRVKYGSYYLTVNGSWTTDINEISFFVKDYDKYVESELIARQPVPGATAGYDFDIRVYHSFIYHAECANLAALRALPTQQKPIGTRTEMTHTDGRIYYYKLIESTAPEGDPLTVRPNDYHATNNPVLWEFTNFITITYVNNFASDFCIDKIQVKFLIGGEDPYDTVIRQTGAEGSNYDHLEKTIYLGSFMSTIVTMPALDFYGVKAYTIVGQNAASQTITTNIISSELIYTAWLRSSAGVGYTNWVRDGILESDTLHGLWLKAYALQYKRSWRLLRGDIRAKSYFGMLNIAKLVSDDNRIYLPMGLTIDDKNCTYSGEFLELTPATGGSNDSGSSSFTSGFSSGFGKSSFN